MIDFKKFNSKIRYFAFLFVKQVFCCLWFRNWNRNLKLENRNWGLKIFNFQFPISEQSDLISNFGAKRPNFQFPISIIIFCFLLFGASHFVSAATEFVSIIDPDQGTGYDFQYLSTWESVTQVDLATTTTKVFSHSGIVGIIPDTSTLVGTSSGAVASTTRVTATQILLYNITGTFESGEKLYIQGAGTDNNYVYLTDAGDSAIAVATCRSTGGSADTNIMEIDGWETSSTTYIKIWTDPEEGYRHNGVWDDSKYHLVAGTGSENTISIRENYVKIDGLQIESSITSTYGSVVVRSSTTGDNQYYFSNNIIRRMIGDIHGSSNYISGINLYPGGDDNNVKIWNNIIYGYTWGINARGASVIISNVTIDNCYGRGIQADDGNDPVLVMNSIVQNTPDAFVEKDGGTFASASDYNISDVEGDAPNDTFTNSALTVNFQDIEHDDYHLSENDTVALNAGTSAVIASVSEAIYDIDGTARGGAFDIGADEVPVSFVSTICENTSAGGDCSEMDYSALDDWNDELYSDLTLDTTRVFGGASTVGYLDANDSVNLCDGATDTGINGTVVGTTSDQILIDGITGTTTPLVALDGYIWNDDACGSANNYWTINGSGDDLGASARAVAKIDGVWTSADTQRVNIYGWTVDSDNDMKVYTTNLARHPGKWDESSYRLEVVMTTTNYSPLRITEQFTTIDGLQILVDNASSTADYESQSPFGIDITNQPSPNKHVISNNIIKNKEKTVEAEHSSGIVVGYISQQKDYLYNNIIYNFTRGISAMNDADDEIYVFNNTIFNTEVGLRTADYNIRAWNNIIASTTDPFYGTFNSDTKYNAIDGTDTPTGGSNSIIGADFDFVSTASGTEDFHIGEDSDAINAGFDVTAATSLFTTDIDGSVRNLDGEGWDIGADERGSKIYRSVGNTDTDLSNTATVTISGTTATFSAEQPDNIGVGDVIQYGNAGSYELAFITARASSTEYSVQAYDGGIPNATTTASMEIFRAYLELNDWETNTESSVNSGIDASVDQLVPVDTDLVASGIVMMVPCYASDDGDDAVMNVDGAIWLTSQQNYIKIYTPVGTAEVGVSQRHNGKWDDDKYNISISSADYVIDIPGMRSVYITFDGLQLWNNYSGDGYTGGINLSGTSNCEISVSNNILRGPDISNNTTGLTGFAVVASSERIIKVWNNISYNWRSETNGSCYVPYDDYIYFYNNTAYNCIHGARTSAGGTKEFYNNIFYNVDKPIDLNGSSISAENNITNSTFLLYYSGGEQSSSPSNILDATLSFVDEANDDFHLAPTDIVAIDAGTSTLLSFPANGVREGNPEYDIDGNYRRTWDIGADEASIEYTASIMEDGTGDFTTLAAWEDGVESDLVATTTAVFTATTSVGQFQSYEISSRLFTGQNSNATGQLIHISTSSSDVEQVLLVNISGDFEVGEEISDGYGTTTIENLGNPVIAVGKIDGTWSSEENASVLIDGFTTGSNNYIKIYTTNNARHDGKWNDSKYRIVFNDRYIEGTPLRIFDDYVRIDGLQIDAAYDGSGGNDHQDGIDINNTGAVVSNCIVMRSVLDSQDGIIIDDIPNNSEVTIYNNIIYNFEHGIYSENRWSDIKQKGVIANNTIINSAISLRYNTGNGGDMYLRNNIVQDSVHTNFVVNDINFSYNLSEDVSAGEYGGIGNIVSVSPIFVDEANNDFHLSELDTVAKDAGTSTISNFKFPISISDIDGQSRYDVAYDIGADEAPTILYRSVGNDTREISATSSTVTILGTTATFNQDQPANMGVGDVLQYGETGYYELAFITGRTSSSTYEVQARDGTLPIATTSASVVVYRAHEYLSDWEAQVVTNVNDGIDESVDDLVLMSNMDLTASNTAMFVPCYASTTADNRRIELDGWITATSSYINIYTPVNTNEVGISQRHDGIWDDSKYRMEYQATSDTRVIHNVENYVRINGLQIGIIQDGYSTGGFGYNYSVGDQIYVENNIIKSDEVGGVGIFSGGNKGEFYAFNNIVYGFNSCVDFANNSNVRKIYNNTLSGCNYGIYNNGGENNDVQNNVVFDNVDDFWGLVSGSEIRAYNASDDGDGDNAIDVSPGVVEAEDWEKVFTDYVNGDFSIRDTNSVLYDAGTTITIVKTDIIGVNRPYHDAFDIGAFEFNNARPSFRIQPGQGGIKMKGYIKFR